VTAAGILLWAPVAALAALGITAWRRRPPEPLWPSLILALVAAGLWALGEALTSQAAGSPGSYWISTVLLYTGVLFLPPIWWWFALSLARFLGHPLAWAGRAACTAPFLLSAAAWMALVTNPWHGSFLRVHPGGHNEYGDLWMVQAIANYLLFLGVLALLAWLRWKHQGDFLQRPLCFMLTASILPLPCNLLYVTSTFDPGFDFTSAAFTLSAVTFFWGVYRGRMFATSPITLRHLLRHETDGVLLLDRAGHRVTSNPAAERLLGWTHFDAFRDALAELAGRLEPMDRPGVPLQRQELIERLDSLRPTGESFRFDPPSGRTLRVQCTPIPGRRGRPLGLALRLRDETALHRASETIAEQAAALEAILAASDEGILVVDPEGRMVYWNQVFTTMWALPEAIVASRDDALALEFVLDQLADPDAFLARVHELYDQPLAESQEELHLRDGRIFERSSRPLLREGTPQGRVWSFRDITARVRAQEERRRLERKMRETQKLESLGILAGGVAHDFNNLLVGILGNTDFALSDLPEDAPLRPCLEDAREAAERAAELTHQMLAYAGRAQRVVESVDLADLVRHTAHLLATSVSERAQLRHELPEALPVQGDATQLRQVVMNLITNASDSLGDQAGVIALRGRRMDGCAEAGAGGGWIVLEVTDTGCGMDAATLDRIFDPFFTTKLTGRGLGLAAVQGIVRSHGGHLEVESTPGRGTTFRIRLPASAPPPKAQPAPDPEDRPWRVSGCVLVVDDEEGVRRVAGRILERAGLEVLPAADGEGAVAMLRERTDAISLVVLDLTMPGMDGAQTLEALRAIRPQLPVLLCTGHGTPGTLKRVPAGEQLPLLPKPYTAQQLLRAVRSALEEPGSPQRWEAGDAGDER